MIDFILYLGYILVIVAALAALLMPLINSISNPKGLVKSGIGLAVLVVFFLIAYAISGSEVTDVYAKFGVDASQSKLIGGVLTMMYLLILVVTGGIVYTEISKMVK